MSQPSGCKSPKWIMRIIIGILTWIMGVMMAIMSFIMRFVMENPMGYGGRSHYLNCEADYGV